MKEYLIHDKHEYLDLAEIKHYSKQHKTINFDVWVSMLTIGDAVNLMMSSNCFGCALRDKCDKNKDFSSCMDKIRNWLLEECEI